VKSCCDSRSGETRVIASDPIVVPQPVAGLENTRVLAAGPLQTCAIAEDGTTRCWGRDVRTGEAIMANTIEPVVVPFPPLEAVSPGSNHSCGISGGAVYCVGNNDLAQLAVGSEVIEQLRPARVLTITDALAVATGDAHSCALRANGDVLCWGVSNSGAAGPFGMVTTPNPIALTELTADIAAGGTTSCAVLEEGALRCWGGGLSDANETVAIGLEGVIDVAQGAAHTCAVLANDSLWCWGENSQGQLGDGTTQDSLFR
jgi:alpha-tubulin suppressor-like RCC1 family protein